MVAKMTALLENKAEADQSLPSKAHLPRELLAFFRRPMDRKTFDDLNKELSSGDKKKIANACYNQIKEACKGLTAESLRNMTDEQVGDHLEQMAYANYLLVEADVLLGIGKDGVDEGKGYPFTKEQRQEVLRLREELQAPLWMTINRASMISEPYYAQFPTESLLAADVNSAQNFSFERGFQTLEPFLKESGAYILSLTADLGDRLAREGLGGVPVGQITWLLPDGTENSKSKRPPEGAMRNGPVVAVFPDKSVKAFTFEMKDGAARWVSGGPEMISSRVDRDLQALPELSKQLKQADHWYVRGSQEFKDVRTAMEKVEKELQTLGKNPTDYQRKRLAEQMQKLLDVSQTYLNRKEQEDEFSSTALERIDAVTAIRNFAQDKVGQLDLLGKMTELTRYDQREAEVLGGLKAGKGNWRGEENQTRMSADPQQDAKAREELEQAKTPEDSLKAYKDIKIPRSNASFDVEGLHQDTVGRIALMINQTSDAPLTGASAQDARTTMAQMILVDLVLKERATDEFDPLKGQIKAGPLESFLSRDIAGRPGVTRMLQNIQNSQVFLEMTENLSGKGFQDFFLENKARNVSGKIMSELFPHKEQIKAAQQPQVNKTAVQNAPAEQKKNAAPKMK